MNQTASALDALTTDEKAMVLQHLLAVQPQLREPAEAYAASLMADEDRHAVADDIEATLQG